MRKLIALSLLASWTLAASDSTDMVESTASATVSVESLKKSAIQPVSTSDARLWRLSMATLAAANALDVHSSWGKHELNGVLAGGNGTLGGRGTTLKIGLQGALMGVEYLLTRGRPHPRIYRAFSYINFSASGVIGVTAMHNYSVQRIAR